MSAYFLSVILPIKGCSELFMLVLRVTVDQPIEWVKQHADEIAARGVADDKTARNVNGGRYSALWVEVVA